MQKKPTFREFFFWKDKEGAISKKDSEKSVFSPLKLLDKHFKKLTFFFYPNFAGSLLWHRQNFADIKTKF